ncbi:MAG: polyprenyl synthetase family protein [Planctomyces sp.]|nr:polyprenyl synthetase family protein [Planctomyces sp.]
MEIAGSQTGPLADGALGPRANGDACPPADVPRTDVKVIPDSPALRDQLRSAADRIAATAAAAALSREGLEEAGRSLLSRCGLDERHLGFAMVLLNNSLWKRSLLAVPFERRLLLTPQRVVHAPDCKAAGSSGDGDRPDGSCDACALERWRTVAERLGYSVIASDGSPAALRQVLEGAADGIVGIASLQDLEKALEPILRAGVPAWAVPLCSHNGDPTTLLRGWIADVLDRYETAGGSEPAGYLPLIRAANRLFREDFSRLLPRVLSATPAQAASPLGMTEDVAYDWLANGGKRFRPFITLAAYDAATGGRRSGGTAAEFEPLPDAVCRVAMAIEAFHKASLVHDDIQDDDLFRYGRETLHRSHGLGPAINIGDYLIGLGYRLVNSCRADLGAEVASDILGSMSQAHLRLCEGQGAEMAWRDRPDWSLTAADALEIYALKTSPAFEAALDAGLRMASASETARRLVGPFCRELGIAFQILNDLKDWQGDRDNKLVAGQDALAVRPTVLLALALDAAGDDQRREIRELLESDAEDEFRLNRLRRVFQQVGAFESAQRLVDSSRQKAQALAVQSPAPALRRLFEFLIATVLADETRTGAAKDEHRRTRPVVQPV